MNIEDPYWYPDNDAWFDAWLDKVYSNQFWKAVSQVIEYENVSQELEESIKLPIRDVTRFTGFMDNLKDDDEES